MLTKFSKIYFLLLISMIFCNSIIANSADRAMVERKLTENRHFLEFINIGISNFGSDEDKVEFRKRVIEYYKAYQLFLRGQYPESFEKIKETHLDIRILYHSIIEKYYLPDLQSLLDANAAKIVSSRDERAIHLLKLGYRDLKISRVKVTKAYNFNKFLNSMRIHFYIEAIKYIRQAKRYAFLSLIESKTPISEKADFKLQTLDDVLNKPEVDVISDYRRVGNSLANMINRKLFLDEYNYFVHHDDNYGFIASGKEDYFKTVITTLRPEDWADNAPKVKINPVPGNSLQK